VKEREKYSKLLGRRIKALREEKKISLKEFESSSITIDRHSLSRIENGKTVPSSYTLFKICQILQVPLSELFAGFEGNFPKK
jgi:transcriptional regulator with XRE-family HTH domain